MKKQISFDTNGIGYGIFMVEALSEGCYELTNEASTMATRYKLVDGAAVDQYPSLTDDEVTTLILKVDADRAAELVAQKTATKGPNITKLAFRNRFTAAEKVVLEMAAMDDTSLTDTVRQQAAKLRGNMKDLDAASYIDLSRPDTRQAVEQLETAGLIGAGRAAEILDTAIQELERYK